MSRSNYFIVLGLLFSLWLPSFSGQGIAFRSLVQPSFSVGSTFTVDSTVDEGDRLPGDGLCATESGACTLRAAIQEANALAGDETILLPSGTYLLTRPGEDNTALNGDLDIASNLTLNGAGAETTVIDGNGLNDRLFDVLSSNLNVQLTHLTLQGGAASLPGGGAILNRGALTIERSVLRSHTTTGDGGAIFNRLTGQLTLISTLVADNSSTNPDGGGGGISNARLLTVRESTIRDNVAADMGGGIYDAPSSNVNLVMVNSTLSGNRSQDSGGGLASLGGVSRLFNVTVANNIADADSNFGGSGGGIFKGINGTIELEHTLIGDNSDLSPATNAQHHDCSGTLLSHGYNLIEQMTGCVVTGETTGNLTGVDALLAPLANNGGDTPTHLLQAGSPALDAGAPDGCFDSFDQVLKHDQRSVLRPQDGNNDGVSLCDIGAVEAALSELPTLTPSPSPTGMTSSPTATASASATPTQSATAGASPTSTHTPSPTPSATLTVTPSTPGVFTVNAAFDATDGLVGDGICASSLATGALCTLRAAIQESNALAGANTILLPPGSYLLSLGGNDDEVAAVGDLDVTDSAGVTISGSGSPIIDGNNVLPIFDVRPSASFTLEGVSTQGSPLAIRNLGTLTVHESSIINGAQGLSNSGNASLTEVTFSGHANGVAIDSFGTLLLQESTVSDNKTGLSLTGNSQTTIQDSTIAFNELGIATLLSTGSLTIEGSTISYNGPNPQAGASGGMRLLMNLEANNNLPLVNISNSTFSGNTAGNAGGGGMYVKGRGAVTLNNVTISNNGALTTGAGGNGGGIGLVLLNNGTFTLQNTLLEGNSSPNQGPDCFTNPGPITLEGHNLIGDTSACTLGGDMNSLITGQAALLGELQDNGGTTYTHELLSGSPAINAGNPALPGSGNGSCESLDQIGTTRPQGAACDIGAFESTNISLLPPELNSLTPNSITAPGAAFTLSLQGSSFNNSSIVRWNGADRATTVISDSLLEAAIPATDVNVGRNVSVHVFNADSGLLSNALSFGIVNPSKPTISSLSPSSIRLGSGNVTVTVNGNQFVSSAKVQKVGGNRLNTFFRSPSQLQAIIPASDLTRIGTISLQVRNPAPGGGVSNEMSISVVNPLQQTIGVGDFAAQIERPGIQSTLVLSWTHPIGWRQLDDVDLRLVDEEEQIVWWGRITEVAGEGSTISLLNSAGQVTALALPGEGYTLENENALLDLGATSLFGPPGQLVRVTFALSFKQAISGGTFDVEASASNDKSDSDGFHPLGSIHIPEVLYLPMISR